MKFTTENVTTDKMLRMMMAYENVKISEMARRTGRSSQALSNRLKTGNFRESELREIGDVLGYDYVVEFRKREGDK